MQSLFIMITTALSLSAFIYGFICLVGIKVNWNGDPSLYMWKSFGSFAVFIIMSMLTTKIYKS